MWSTLKIVCIGMYWIELAVRMGDVLDLDTCLDFIDIALSLRGP